MVHLPDKRLAPSEAHRPEQKHRCGKLILAARP